MIEKAKALDTEAAIQIIMNKALRRFVGYVVQPTLIGEQIIEMVELGVELYTSYQSKAKLVKAQEFIGEIQNEITQYINDTKSKSKALGEEVMSKFTTKRRSWVALDAYDKALTEAGEKMLNQVPNVEQVEIPMIEAWVRSSKGSLFSKPGSLEFIYSDFRRGKRFKLVNLSFVGAEGEIDEEINNLFHNIMKKRYIYPHCCPVKFL